MCHEDLRRVPQLDACGQSRVQPLLVFMFPYALFPKNVHKHPNMIMPMSMDQMAYADNIVCINL